MKKGKKKLYVILIICIVFLGVIASSICIRKNSTKNILIENLINKVQKKETFDGELLKNYNNKNIEKINKGESLCAEDYFFIAYDYYIDKDLEKVAQYTKLSKSKENKFENRFIKLYNDYLINYVDTSINPNEKVLQNINKVYEEVTISDWNKYYHLLYSELTLYFSIDNGFDCAIDKIENILMYEDKLDENCIVLLKDTLSVAYIQKGHYAKGLETCLEIQSLLKLYDINSKDFYEARAVGNMGVIYEFLEDYDTAIELLQKALNMPIEDKIYENNVKLSALNNLISIYFAKEKIDEAQKLLEDSKEFLDDSYIKNIDLMYYLSKVKYHMEKYEKDGAQASQEDLKQAEYYLELIKNRNMDNSGGLVVDVDNQSAVYEYYLEYLKGNTNEALESYKNLEASLSDNVTKTLVINKMISIYNKEGNYQEAYKYADELMQMQHENSLLINKDYSAYSIEKYSYELNLRALNQNKIRNYIKVFILILISSISFIIMVMRIRLLKEKNRTDGLTKVYNRTYFNEIYDKKLKGNKAFFVFMFDIDNFKKVNDTYGHLTGDEVLKRVAKTTKDVVGINGSVFRYGGEEFVVLVGHKDEITIRNMAENIRKQVENLVWDNGMKITISVGVADSRLEKKDVLEVADKRLYLSKTSGKNKITLVS